MSFGAAITLMALAVVVLIVGIVLALHDQTGAAVICLFVGFGTGFAAFLFAETE